MSKIDPDEAISQAFEAFCVLSDAQEHVGRYMGLEHPANKLINHAKLHLLRIIGDNVYPPTGIRLTCSLGEGSRAE